MVASQTSRVLLLSSAALLWVLPSTSRAAAVQAAPAPAASKRQYTPADFARFAPRNALDITGDYVAGFKAAGYPSLTPDQLVALKALGVTADYARAVRESSREIPSAERLVELKAIGFSPR